MGWKDWSYWLRGGILLSCIYLIWIVILILSPFNIAASFLLSITQPISAVGPFSNLDIIFQTIFVGLQGIIFYFIIGVIIGFIYGKIKKRMENNQNE